MNGRNFHLQAFRKKLTETVENMTNNLNEQAESNENERNITDDM